MQRFGDARIEYDLAYDVLVVGVREEDQVIQALLCVNAMLEQHESHQFILKHYRLQSFPFDGIASGLLLDAPAHEGDQPILVKPRYLIGAGFGRRDLYVENAVLVLDAPGSTVAVN